MAARKKSEDATNEANAETQDATPETAEELPPAPIWARLREAYTHRHEGLNSKLPAGLILTSTDYDLDRCHRAGAVMDVIDPDSMEVLCAYSELE